ncbi:GNAT family N-acetyltransferase [Paenibacillus spongiae]|uniref:GNAT family N-acetyltransferase n=1 Tax=Paenibacillus spongiae TaxID=2909671 RepID=A0ABY5S6K3_9BACL|nr:GNAT family N-acetyltransferase [Paenibacillus spongiae]UVI29294.1 GNAT family N-acetyltransferase [Paenibacillus spongiae]
MDQLSPRDYHQIDGIIQDRFNCRNVFVHSVLDQNQPGTVYVNDSSHPTSGLVVHRGGCYYVFGDTADSEFNRALIDFLQNRFNHSNYFDLYVSSLDWIRLLEPALKGNVVRLTRSHYILREDAEVNRDAEIPEGYQLSAVDERLFIKYRSTMDRTYELLWGSEKAYLQHAFGFCLLAKDEFASVCNTFFVGGGLIAPDIVTLDNHRNKGLAAIVCTSFIKASRKLGLTPYWDCDAGNTASNRLANRLGFTKVGDVPILWWHENQDVIHQYLKKYHYSTE